MILAISRPTGSTNRMWRVIIAATLGLAAAGAEAATLTASDWPAPRDAAALTRQAAVAALVQALMDGSDRTLVIRHAGGEDGAQFAAVLRDALVALGVPSMRMRFEPAAAAPGQLNLELVTDRH
jgi:hypothetical protein